MTQAAATQPATIHSVTTLATRPYVLGDHGNHSLTELVCGIVERPVPRWWWPAFLISLTVASGALFAAAYLISTGVGVWGENQPVGWAFDITNFVFWVGIGHAGTLISAILFLLRQKWRTSINRFAEAMTLFAVACAGVYPLIHVGRVWMAFYLAPIPNSNAIWPNFRSPLLWDVFAVSTYATVSLLFWYVGLIPDLATLRDRATTRTRQWIYGFFALGWRGSARHWHHYEVAYLLLAGLATPLVVSVHTIVSFDFATSVIPGWHTTIFPPYFVAGAILSGFAMVLTLMIPARELFGLRDLVTDQHLDNMARVLLSTSLIVGYAYGVELFTAWYGVNFYERFAFVNRVFGPLAWGYAIMVLCNVIVPQLLWSGRVRGNPWVLLVISILVNVGMWFERFVIIVGSLERDFLPSSWGRFVPTWVDILQMVGVFGLFFTLMLLFLRFLPMIALSEVKGILPHSSHAESGHQATDDHSVARPAQVVGSHMSIEREQTDLFGVIATFAGPAELLEATRETRSAGYQDLDTFSPFPIHGMGRALGLRPSILPWMVLVAGILGAVVALGGMLCINVIEYPIIVGGKPHTSIEPLIPITFEVCILFSAITAVIGSFFLCGLPRLHHPLFGSVDFARTTDDGFFLAIEASDPRFDADQTVLLLESLGGKPVTLVEG